MAQNIEDYAIIGDGRTIALISRNGDLAWLCLPRLDSPAAFAALLGEEQNGRWLLTIPEAVPTQREYIGSSFILRTTYDGEFGQAVITEWMDTSGEFTRVIRQVKCTHGHIQVLTDLRVRFGYGAIVPWAARGHDPDGAEVLRFLAGPDALTFHSPTLPRGHDHQHENLINLSAGEVANFVMTWSQSWAPTPGIGDIDGSFSATKKWWTSWCVQEEIPDAYEVDIRRSLLTLRALTEKETAGVAAAATTSLPEGFGGERNWDYRFCWLRDSALTLSTLIEAGFVQEASHWRNWLLRAIAGDPADIQIMYGLDGRRFLPEYTLAHLPGYENSTPVRVGNAASTQVQHDVYGEVLGALAAARDAGVRETVDSWAMQRHLVGNLIDTWSSPDHGIWEIRGPKQHFTHSKIMCWYAIERALTGITDHGLPGPAKEWEVALSQIRDDVLTHGVDPVTNSFVQHYATTQVDASLLMICHTGFVPATDSRFKSTVRRIASELSDGPHVLRYRTETGVDGLPGEENHFYACSFWLVEALAAIGAIDDATQRFDQLLATGNDLGLFAEQYDSAGKRFAGNYPQALSHLALVGAAKAIRRAQHVMNKS